MTQVRRIHRLTSMTLEELNFQLGLISDRLDQMEGYRGTPQFHSAVDFNQQRATNAGAAVESADLTPFQQISDEVTSQVTAQIAGILTYNKPVGTIHMSINPANPATYLGYGTWVAFGAGKVVVGVNAADSDFDTVLKTGGSKTLASHVHPAGTTVDNNGGTTIQVNDGTAPAGNLSILQPYICVYIWQRTA